MVDSSAQPYPQGEEGLKAELAKAVADISDLEKKLTASEIGEILLTSQNTDLKIERNGLIKLLDEDETTGVKSKRFMKRELGTQITSTTKYKDKRYGFLFCLYDADGFKRVNDEVDHPAGDEVLKGIAKIIKGELPAYAVVGRWYQGDEFAVILPILNTNNPDEVNAAYGTFERIREKVEKRNPFTHFVYEADGAGNPVKVEKPIPRNIKVTLSGGVVRYDPVKHKHDEQLVKDAEKALSLAKARGKNKVEFIGEKSIYSSINREEKGVLFYLGLVPVAAKRAARSFMETYTGRR